MNKRVRTTIGENDRVNDQHYDQRNCTTLLYEYLKESTRHSLLMINLHKILASEFIKFSDLANNWDDFLSHLSSSISRSRQFRCVKK